VTKKGELFADSPFLRRCNVNTTLQPITLQQISALHLFVN